MRHTTILAAVSVVAFVVTQGAAASAATAKKPAATAPKAAVVSGKIVKIDAGLGFVTLDNGKTYRLTKAGDAKGVKVGQKIKLTTPAKA